MSFWRIEEAVLLEEAPCGCQGDGHSLALGVLFYEKVAGVRVHPEDLEECRQCGAVWRLIDRLDGPPVAVAVCSEATIDETIDTEQPAEEPKGP